jgi:hypothetical protein
MDLEVQGSSQRGKSVFIIVNTYVELKSHDFGIPILSLI